MIFCVLSDSHGDLASIDSMLGDLQAKDIVVQAFIHAGDCAIDTDYIRRQTGLPTYTVWGNSDIYRYRQIYKPDEFIEIDGHTIWLTHGHKYLQDSDDVHLLREQAQIFSADIVIYGHTHKPHIVELEHILFLNPGSTARPRNSNSSYALLDINGSNIQTTICEIC